MNNLPVPFVPTVDPTFIIPRVVSDGYAYFRDGDTVTYGPASVVIKAIELHARDKKYARIQAGLSPWNRLAIMLTTGFALQSFDWTDKVLDGISHVYRQVFGA